MVFVLGVFFSANAQQRSTTKSDLKLSLLAPELIYEMEIGKAASLKLGIGYGLIGEYSNNNGQVTKNTLQSHAVIQAMPRIFTTRTKRMRMGKNIDHFSGGYVAFPLDYRIGIGYSVGVVYGTQGMLGSSKWFYDLFIGLGYADLDLEKSSNVTGAYLPNGVSLGFIF